MNDNNYQLFLKAKELIKIKKYQEAIIILREIYQLEPYDRFIKFELAKLLIKMSSTKQEGKKMLFELLNTQNRTYATLELGRLEVSEGNNVKAREYFEQLLNTQNRTYAMLELGRLEVNEGNNVKAREYFEQLLNTQNRTHAMLELGRLEVNEGNNVKAREYFEQLLNKQNRTYAMLELGRLEVSEGNNVKAREYFEQLLNTQNRTYAALELGRLEVSEGNNVKAREYFEQLLNTQNRIYAMHELIFLNIKEGQYLEAYKMFKNGGYKKLERGESYHLDIFLKYKLGIIEYEQISNKDYHIRQLFNYDVSSALEHITKHLDEDDKKIKHTVFNQDVNLEELFNYSRKQIKYLNPIEISTSHKYILDCEQEIATIDGYSTRRLKVVTIPNTDHILTMYPVRTYEKKKNKIKQLKING